jgi:diguanylate cyclase (GGDEF)-like protein
MQSSDAEYRAFLEQQILNDVDARSVNGTYVYTVAWLMIGGLTGFYLENVLTYWALSAFLFIQGLTRFSVNRYYAKSQSSNSRWRIAWLYFNVLAPAAVYSSLFSLAFLLPAYSDLFIYLLMSIFALLSAGTVIFAPFKKLSLSYVIVLTLIPFTTAMFVSNERFIEGLLLLPYAVYMFFQAVRLNREYLLNIKQRYKLNKLNQQDSLTGIANRRFFDLSIESAWKSALRSKASLALVLIDIDFFKKVNDQYGHAAGDDVIKNIAQIIQTTCQRDSDLVARFGGEEYAILFENFDVDKIANFCEKIRQQIESTPTIFENHEISVTASLGVAFSKPKLSKSTGELFKVADKNLYAAKESGRNQVKVSEY